MKDTKKYDKESFDRKKIEITSTMLDLCLFHQQHTTLLPNAEFLWYKLCCCNPCPCREMACAQERDLLKMLEYNKR